MHVRGAAEAPQVRYLKIIEKSGYQALPWVRYITQNGGMRPAPLTHAHPPQTTRSAPSRRFLHACELKEAPWC